MANPAGTEYSLNSRSGKSLTTAGIARTDWVAVALLLGAGIAAALHAGKVPGALPLLAHELGMGLAASGLLVALISLTGALAGLVVGLAAERIGTHRTVVLGLGIAGCASWGGALAHDVGSLLVFRALEGLGFIMAVVAAPSLIVAACRPADSRLALGVWGVYTPVGMTLMLLAGSLLLDSLGWRGLWWLAGGLNLAWAVVLMAGRSRVDPRSRHTPKPSDRRLTPGGLAKATLRRGPMLLSGCFVTYAAQYIAVASFLPTLLVDQAGLSLRLAGLAGTAVVAVNIFGNLASGWLAARGWAYRRVLAGSSLAMGLLSVGLFTDVLPLTGRYVCALGFTAVGGLIPGTLLGLAPQFATRPDLAAGVVGLLIQGAGMGQLLGPPMLGLLVEATGSWAGAAWLTFPCALLCAACAWALPRPAGGTASDDAL